MWLRLVSFTVLIRVPKVWCGLSSEKLSNDVSIGLRQFMVVKGSGEIAAKYSSLKF